MNPQNPYPHLFQPIQVGDLQVKNRIVMSAMTRTRCDPKTGVPNDLLVKYYSDRADTGIILTECTPVSQRGNGTPGSAGIWNDDQVEGWKRVTEAVHAKGGLIFLQIWHCGRSTHSSLTGLAPWSSSPIAIRKDNYRAQQPHEVPHEMTIDEIKLVIEEFRQGALRAKAAGFDGLELHAAHGYLIDQFLRANKRTDEYGGSVENKARFCLEALDAVISVFGNQRVGVKITPVGHYNDMYVENALELYTYLLKEFEKRHIAFVELKDDNDPDNSEGFGYPASKSQIPDVYEAFKNLFSGPIIGNNAFTPERAEKEIANGRVHLVSFAKPILANPDFVRRVQNGWPLNANYDFKTFYATHPSPQGYTDYPTYEEEVELKNNQEQVQAQ